MAGKEMRLWIWDGNEVGRLEIEEFGKKERGDGIFK
jgi:hypothetical protein